MKDLNWEDLELTFSSQVEDWVLWGVLKTTSLDFTKWIRISGMGSEHPLILIWFITLILIILTHITENRMFEGWKFRHLGPSLFSFCFLSNWQDFFNCKWQKPTLLRLRGECANATEVRSDRKQGWGASEHPPETSYFLSPSLTWWPLWPSNSMTRHHNHSLTYSFNSPVPLTRHRAVSRNISSAFSTQSHCGECGQSKTHLHADGSPLQFMTSTPSDHESRHIALFHSLPRFWITIPTFNGLGKADFQFHGCSHHLQWFWSPSK